MDLTVETKDYVFSASSGFDYIVIYLCNNLKQSPGIGSYHKLTRKEVKGLIEYLKQNHYGDGRDFWIVDRLTNAYTLMEGNEAAEFCFW